MGHPIPANTTTAASLLEPPTPPVITTTVSPQPVTTPAAATVQASLADPVVLIHRTPAGGSAGTTTVWTSAGRGNSIGMGTPPARPAAAGRGNSFIQSPVVTQTLQSTPTTQVFSSTILHTTAVLISVPVSAVSDRPVRQTKPNPKYKDYVGPHNTTSQINLEYLELYLLRRKVLNLI